MGPEGGFYVASADNYRKTVRGGLFSRVLRRDSPQNCLANRNSRATADLSSGRESTSAASPVGSDTLAETLLRKDCPRPELPMPFAPSRESARRSSTTSNASCRIELRPRACPAIPFAARSATRHRPVRRTTIATGWRAASMRWSDQQRESVAVPSRVAKSGSSRNGS